LISSLCQPFLTLGVGSNTAARKIESLEACRFGHPSDIGGNDTDYLQRRFGRQRFSKPFSRATLSFSEWTRDGELRQTVFLARSQRKLY